MNQIDAHREQALQNAAYSDRLADELASLRNQFGSETDQTRKLLLFWRFSQTGIGQIALSQKHQDVEKLVSELASTESLSILPLEYVPASSQWRVRPQLLAQWCADHSVLPPTTFQNVSTRKRWGGSSEEVVTSETVGWIVDTEAAIGRNTTTEVAFLMDGTLRNATHGNYKISSTWNVRELGLSELEYVAKIAGI